MVDQILKTLDNLRITQIGQVLEDSSIRKKEKMLLCVGLADFIATLRPTPQQMSQITGRVIESLIHLCDDRDADVRNVADESLNRTLRALADTSAMRLQIELHKEIQKNGPARCVRTALLKFSQLCEHPTAIRPGRGRNFANIVVPSFISIISRSEENIHETLQLASANIFKALAIFMNENEIKSLLKPLISNLLSSSSVIRRCSASNIVTIINSSRKPDYFRKYVLHSLLDLLVPVREETSQQCILGVLYALRLLIPNILSKEYDPTESLIQIYELTLHYSKHEDHNIVTASLEALNQLLKMPRCKFKNLLLDTQGITHSYIFSPVNIRRDLSHSEISVAMSLPATDISLINDSADLTFGALDPTTISVSTTPFIGSFIEDIEDSEGESSVSEDITSSGATYPIITNDEIDISKNDPYDGDDLISLAPSCYEPLDEPLDYGSFTDEEMPIIYCMSHLLSFLLTGTPGGLKQDSQVRVSIKSLVLSCLSHAVTVYPNLFLLSLCDQPSKDILQYSKHPDPQIKGNLCILLGNMIGSTGYILRKDDNEALDALFEGLNSDAATERLALRGVRSCIYPLILCKANAKAKIFLNRSFSVDSYWLNKVRLIEVYCEIDFLFLGDTHNLQSKVLKVFLNYLTDKDGRVRKATCEGLARLIPNLLYKVDCNIEYGQKFYQKLFDIFNPDSKSELLLFPPYSEYTFKDCNFITERNLSRIISILQNYLLEADEFSKMSGYVECLRLLSDKYQPINYPKAWNCTPSDSSCLLIYLLTITSHNNFFLDINLLENSIALIGNLYAGYAFYGVSDGSIVDDSKRYWNNFHSNHLSDISDNLLKLLLKILNIYAQLHEERLLKSATSTLGLIFNKKSKSGNVLLPFGLNFNSKKENEDKTKKLSKSSFYNKLLNILRSAHTVYKISLDPSTSEKFLNLLKSILHVLSTLLEMGQPADTIPISEEILFYLRTTVVWQPCATIMCVIQLLKSIFGVNLTSFLKKTEIVERNKFDSLYENIYQYPLKCIIDRLANRATNLKENKNEKYAFCHALPLHHFMKNVDKAAIETHVRLFEPMVIKSLQLYTITNNTELQSLVLSLLIQLIQLRVNYCLLDADLKFLSFVKQQFELIENGQISQVEILLPKLFQFFILLSTEKHRNLITMPAILQLFDNILASERPMDIYCLPALKPIVDEIFLNKKQIVSSDESKELQAQNEVLLNMLLRLSVYPKVLYYLAHCEKVNNTVFDLVFILLENNKIILKSFEDRQHFYYFMKCVPQTYLKNMLKLLYAEPYTCDDMTDFYSWLAIKSVILEIILIYKENTILDALHLLDLTKIDLSKLWLSPKETLDPINACSAPVYSLPEQFSRIIYSILAKAALVIVNTCDDTTLLQNELHIIFLILYYLFFPTREDLQKTRKSFLKLITLHETNAFQSITELFCVKLRSLNVAFTGQYVFLINLLWHNDVQFWYNSGLRKSLPRKFIILSLAYSLKSQHWETELIQFFLTKYCLGLFDSYNELPVKEFLLIIIQKEEMLHLILNKIKALPYDNVIVVENVLKFLSTIDDSHSLLILKVLLKILPRLFCTHLTNFAATLAARKCEYLLTTDLKEISFEFKITVKFMKEFPRLTNLLQKFKSVQSNDQHIFKYSSLNEDWYSQYVYSSCMYNFYPDPSILNALQFKKLRNLMINKDFNSLILKNCFSGDKNGNLFKTSREILFIYLSKHKSKFKIQSLLQIFIKYLECDLVDAPNQECEKFITSFILEDVYFYELGWILKLLSSYLKCPEVVLSSMVSRKYLQFLKKFSGLSSDISLVDNLGVNYNIPNYLVNLLRETIVLVYRTPHHLKEILTPPEIIEDFDCLKEFIKKFTKVGWRTKSQFEEIWSTLLRVLVLHTNEKNEESVYVLQNVIVAIDGISTLLQSVLHLPKSGDPTRNKYFHHSRDSYYLMEYESSFPLRFIRNDFLLANLETLGKSNRYHVGQLSLEYLWTAVQAPGSEVFRVTLFSNHIELDIPSCTHFLLDIYSQWLSQPQDSRLLIAVLKNCLVLTDLFNQSNQFQRLLDLLLNLESSLQIIDSPHLSLFAILMAKCLGVLLPYCTDNQSCNFIEHLDRLKQLMIRSENNKTCRLAIIQALLYLLEAPVLSRRLRPPSKQLANSLFYNVGDNDAVLAVLSFVPFASDLIQLFCQKRNFWSEELEAHNWALLIYLLQNYQIELLNCNTQFLAFLLNSVKEQLTTDTVQNGIALGLEKLVLAKRLDPSEIISISQNLISNRSSIIHLQHGLQFLATGCFLEKRSSQEQTMYETPEGISTGMERLSILLERLRHCYVGEAVPVAKLISYFLADFSPFDVLTKLIQEFLSLNHPHPEILAKFLFQVLGQADLKMVQDWIVFSLSSLTQNVSIHKCTWRLLCFFVSASRNKWLRETFPIVLDSLQSPQQRQYETLFCDAALDFIQELPMTPNNHRNEVIRVFERLRDSSPVFTEVLSKIIPELS